MTLVSIAEIRKNQSEVLRTKSLTEKVEIHILFLLLFFNHFMAFGSIRRTSSSSGTTGSRGAATTATTEGLELLTTSHDKLGVVFSVHLLHERGENFLVDADATGIQNLADFRFGGRFTLLGDCLEEVSCNVTHRHGVDK